MSQETYIAATRFGLGLSSQDAAAMQASPKQWLLTQLSQPAPSAYLKGLAPSRDILRTMIQSRMENQPSAPAKNNQGKRQKTEQDREATKAAKKQYKDVFLRELRERLQHAVTTPTPFHERLVNFWSNHFTVSVKKAGAAGVVGAFEREAIRPRVTGTFLEMLVASSTHPAMLLYLDNAQSTGPNSAFGRRGQKGINENLAREILELHTLGVNGGYTQADVTSFANIITGWTIAKNPKQGNLGEFFFDANHHEPGAQVVLGKTYDQPGVEQGMAVLRDIAASPSTARFIATKLARHFIADVPPPEAVDALAASFSQTGGDLMAVYRTLLDLPQAWQLAAPKVKNSYDVVVSAARLCGLHENDIDWCLQSLRFLGDVPFNANSPAGYSDMARDIAGPEALLRRVEWAQSAVRHLNPSAPATQLADLALGAVMSPTTRNAIAAAQAPQALALLLASPEFQRR